MLIKEFRIPLPITVDEYQVAQLWSVAEMSKDETGGGEGIEVRENYSYDNEEHGKGQYTLKIYHLASRIPKFLQLIAPEGSLEFTEEAWNSYPYSKTVVTNPRYMKDDFFLSIETWHKPDLGQLENVHNLTGEDLQNREVINIDIAKDVNPGDYKPEFDPLKVDSGLLGRGPLTMDWLEDLHARVNLDNSIAHMCAYKLVKCHFKWWGFQQRVENMIQSQEKRLFANFHRQVFCWMKNWHNLNMDDIRRIEDDTRRELEELRKTGNVKGMKVQEN